MTKHYEVANHLIIFQIFFEENFKFKTVVVLIRWEFGGPLSLVKNFRLKVRKGTVADMNQNEYELGPGEASPRVKRTTKKSRNTLVSRDDIPPTSTSIMLNIKNFDEGIWFSLSKF